MAESSLNMLALLVTAGAVAFAIAVALVTARLTLGTRNLLTRWQDKSAAAERKALRAESVFGSYPGLVLVWEETTLSDENSWGEPRVYGSPAAMAALVDHSEPGKPKAFARRLLDGLADHRIEQKGTEEKRSVRQYVMALRREGQPFSGTLVLPSKKILQLDGRTAGAQVVLWIEDASVRAENERTAMTTFQKDRFMAAADPVAFLDMLNKAPEPVWRVSGAGRLLWANEAYISAVGGESLADVISRQVSLDSESQAQAIRALADYQVVTESRIMVVEGERRTMQVTIYPITGGAACMATDVSEETHLREELDRHIRAHDETLNGISEAVVVFNPDQSLHFYNKAFAAMFKLPEGWLETRPTHGEWLGWLRERSMLPPHDDWAEWKAAEIGYYQDWPEEVPDELWGLPDGRTLRLARQRHPLGGLLLLLEDITDQLTMRSQYNTLIKVQKATLDKLTEGIAVFGSDGRLRIFNAAFEEMWGLDMQALGEKPHFSKISGESLRLYHDRNFWSEMIARVTDPSPHARQNVVGEIVRSDDKILTFLSRPLPDGATLIAWDDVTEARQTETALMQRAEALETADQLKSEFIGHVSYQLRTPLTTISGYADMLQTGLAGELTARQLDSVNAIMKASGQLAKTIDDILDISAIEANTMELDLGDVDLHDLLAGTLDFMATRAEDTEIRLHLECPEDIGKIRADERRLKQIMYNLVHNAQRASQAGGEIHVGARRVAGAAEIWVKDNGVGIAPAKQHAVFDRFESGRDGAGLGLTLVHSFVELHGGWVELESDEGKGTKVTIHLPETAAVTAAHPEFDFARVVGG